MNRRIRRPAFKNPFKTDMWKKLGRRSVLPNHRLLFRLNEKQQRLVAAALDKEGDITVEDVKAFRKMDAGLREFKMQLFIASLWENSRDYREIPEYRDEKGKLYGMTNVFGKSVFRRANKKEKLSVVLDEDNLSERQKGILKKIFGETDTDSIYALRARRFKRMAMEYVRSLSRSYTLGSLLSVHRHGGKVSAAVKKLVNELDVASDPGTFCEDILIPGSTYTPKTQELRKFRDMMNLDSLRNSARVQDELYTLLEFVGVEVKRAVGKTSYKHGSSRENKKRGYRNQDRFLSLEIVDSNGTKMEADFVFDGAGGREHGDKASNMTREVFKIAGIAGWITHPRDVRLYTYVAHTIIIADSISKGRGVAETPATTLAATFRNRILFFGIHCGDSRWGLANVTDRTKAESRDHVSTQSGQEGSLTSAIGARLERVDINNSNARDPDAIVLKRGKRYVSVATTDGFHEDIDLGTVVRVVKQFGDKARKELMRRIGVILTHAPLDDDATIQVRDFTIPTKT